MTKDEIINTLVERLRDEGLYFLVALKKSNEPILKEKLRDLVNEYYLEKKGISLIKSRYTLDTWTSRLEGAGLVDVKEIGRARMYSLSTLGNEVLQEITKK